MRTAIYPGTFDPITKGHLDIIERASKLFDKLIVTVAENKLKKDELFTVEERLGMIQSAIAGYTNVEPSSPKELTVDYAKGLNACAFIRGLRFVSDIENEFQMAWMNRHLNKDIVTVFLMPNEKYTHLNSTIIREVAKLGGNVESFVTDLVAERLKEKFNK